MNPESHYEALDRWERRALEEPEVRCRKCGSERVPCWCEIEELEPDNEEGPCPPAIESSPGV